jgi:AraC family transcriptional regulator, transcriptional activator of pobA
MEKYREVNIRELRSRFPVTTVCDELSEDLFIAELKYESEDDIIKHPCRFDGYLAFFCYKGHFNIEVNLRTFQVKEGSLFVYTPGNIVRVSGISKEDRDNLHIVLIAASNDLIHMAHFDFNKLYDESLRLMENPCVEISGCERDICRKYLDLVRDISTAALPNSRDAVSSLITSIFYLMAALWADRLSEARQKVETGGRSVRSRATFEDFLALVKDNHRRERNLNFYAEKLYLTPKYLSKLVKTVSGKSAHEWIDSFVIVEAKNMLKYSDLSIKTIVYDLNFPNQTTFYRFFKAQTGMTPSEYRKS